MKKIAIAAALGGLLSLPAWSDGIYVGDVKFTAAEICSREEASILRPNSGCLPLTRVSNIQNYYFEGMRLPISHEEAKRVDAAAHGFLEAPATALQQIADAVAGLQTSANAIQSNSLPNLDSDIDALTKDKKFNSLTNLLATTKQHVKDAINAAQKMNDATKAFNFGTKQPLTLAQIKQGTKQTVDYLTELEQKIDACKVLANAKTVDTQQGTKAILALTVHLGKLTDKKFEQARSSLELLQQHNFNTLDDTIETTNSLLTPLQGDLANLDQEVNKLGDGEDAKRLSDLIQKITKAKIALAQSVAAAQTLETNLLISLSLLQRTLPDVQQQVSAINTFLKQIKLEKTDKKIAALQLREVANIAARLLEMPPADSAVQQNLLPSLIGRFFVTEQWERGHILRDVGLDKTASDIRYKMPEHGGNMEFLPANKTMLAAIQTEVLVNTDLTGVIRKTMAASGSVDVNQVVTTVLDKVGVRAAIKPQLTAALSAALSSTSVGSGNYYYVSMTDEVLDELRGKTLRECISTQPFSRDEARLSKEDHLLRDGDSALTANSNCQHNVKALMASYGVLTLDTVTTVMTKKQGLGLITGVAVLRTRSGQTEACSNIAVGVRNPAKANSTMGNDATTCDQLRNILLGHGVPSASIPATINDLNASYRRESYKILRIGDHASVLAIQWIPIVLPKP